MPSSDSPPSSAATILLDETGADEAVLEVVSLAALRAFIDNGGRHVNAWPLARHIVIALREAGYAV